ncbi:hypothetical protein [Rubrivivax albus]|uniref:TonB C-terminal domain-containing protein n=1 Tax=Rubrivivax albus TaxID=2499835 RepID=A0A3S2X296_9BURK|nr:hypothetical protein [Rubrivivax albus]RVT52454.1 hypothetical protein ENE75_08440 [Rubrivivax albus]
MARWHRLAAAVLAWGCAGTLAQTVSLPPSEALACMTPPEAERGTPAYPQALVDARIGDTIKVELVFTGPQASPEVRLLEDRVHDRVLTESVRQHVSAWRVPCMRAGGEPVRIAQTYVFRPDDGRNVVALPPRDAGEAARERQRQCLTRITPDSLPDYPTRARSAEEQGSFLVRLRFATAVDAPDMQIVAGPRSSALRRALADFVPGYRLPCHAGEGPVSLDFLFVFRLQDTRRVVLEDMTLTRFLGAAREVPPARFDTGAMGCPFDLRVQHFQPFKPHVVGQLGEARPERLDLIEWLSRIELKVERPTALALLGEEFTLSVPCGTLNF